jgi:hypothetical protein
MSRVNCCQNPDNPDCVCSICQLQLNENVVEVHCNNKHYFHIGCIEEWLKYNYSKNSSYIPKCPMCRKEYTTYGCNGNVHSASDILRQNLGLDGSYDVEDDELPDNIPDTIWQIRNLSLTISSYRNDPNYVNVLTNEIARLRAHLNMLQTQQPGGKKKKRITKTNRKRRHRKTKSRKHRRKYKR